MIVGRMLIAKIGGKVLKEAVAPEPVVAATIKPRSPVGMLNSHPKTRLLPSLVKLSSLTKNVPTASKTRRIAPTLRMSTARISCRAKPVPTTAQGMRRRLVENRAAIPINATMPSRPRPT
jgi:hypothetical protein